MVKHYISVSWMEKRDAMTNMRNNTNLQELRVRSSKVSALHWYSRVSTLFLLRLLYLIFFAHLELIASYVPLLQVPFSILITFSD